MKPSLHSLIRPSWRLDRAARCSRLWVCGLPLALVLAACGPGVGGTGIGADLPSLASFGAIEASVCKSEFAARLNCSQASAVAGAPTSPALDAGTGTLVLSDATGRIRIQLDGNQVELQAPCQNLVFKGVWGQVPGQAPRYFGAFETASSVGPGSLALETSGTSIGARVLDQEGRTLAGPFVLTPSQGAAPASCG
jgi:hypothetical protein